MTLAGTVMGTAGYLAPEQARGEPAGAASDRYSLAVVAYELLTGGRPFERGSETAEAAAHIHEPIPPASERGVGLPRGVDAVFDRALAKDPGARYSSSAELVEALDRALTTEETAPTRALAAVPLRREPARSPTTPTRSRRLWAVPLLVVALLATLVGGGLAALLSTGGGEARERPAKPARAVTVTQRETLPGTTVVQTVTKTTRPPAETAEQSTPPAPAAATVSTDQAVALTDQATAYIRSGNWTSAWKTVKPALRPLSGTYSDGFRYEAYANYDAGKALAEVGRCQRALAYLDRSESLQGSRSEIDDARALCGA